MKWDCCMTAGEPDLLELRMRELGPVVDRFVFAEADRTHAGRPKPFRLRGSLKELCANSGVTPDRVRVVEVTDMPSGGDPWERERHQRECIWRGLRDVDDKDVMAFSDCDEIPRREVWAGYSSEMGPRKFEQHSCYYWLNCVGGHWCGSVIAPVAWMRRHPLSAIRNQGLVSDSMSDGGWHFSFLGGIEAVRNKLENYAHQDVNLPHWRHERWLRVAMHTPIDLFRRGLTWRFVPPSEDYLPHAVIANPEHYAPFIKDVGFSECWINDEQLCWLVDTYWRVVDLSGEVLELGSWEGRSAVALANMAYPDTLTCVDTWLGSATGNHAAEPGGAPITPGRNVHERFCRNVSALTPGNVRWRVQPTWEFLQRFDQPVKFAHIDASHHYDDVSREIRGLKPLVVPGGVLCGDDIVSASRERADLSGGVERAVDELLPGYERLGNFWIWQRRE
jgi:beta-1,4-mannosyl-glycoprotein beta-1,4-N-acetylglucosaminyltransferase